ncbi:unnamed protein product [Echinostoma caproni]|uniref:hypoxia-inducible factor-proline dioxygenase n=1 Tax=Echinostoma caproni TaxID=27848 RepID=A0A182ZZR0_9TREM|nr:unnamed protein product [Echinostoma caproni]
MNCNNLDAICDTSCRPEPVYSKDSDVQNELTRISCYLAGEIEVPDGVPCWKVLYNPVSARDKNEVHKSESSDQRRSRAEKRKLEPVNYQAKRSSIRTDIELPIDFDSCFSRLWNHATKHSIVNAVLHCDPFAERLRRIGELAKGGLRERGFFTMKNLLGPEHAVRISQWAWNRWRKQPHLFRPGKVSVNESNSVEVRRDLVAWIHPDLPISSSPIDAEERCLVPYVQLLFLYIDAVVRAVGGCVQNRYGEWAVVNGKSWATLSSYRRQPEEIKEAVGYVAHYDNPDTLCDGRILTALYYLNPNWEREWGGQFVIWPYQDKSISSKCSPTTEQSKPLAILPTLDRFVLFFADQRILHCVQPVLACSAQSERLAFGIWYFDRYEREEYLRSQDE